jgi:NRPS condensation-like uncharacterized protein
MTRGMHRTSARRPDTLPRRPFHLPDELTCYFDTPDEPANIHLELQLPGHLDRAAFRDAAAAALLANFRASSRRAGHGRLARRYAWEYPARLDADPVTFTTFADETELAAQREAFIARSPSIDASPPAALLVASGPDRDYVILNAHHATMDGLSWLDLLRDMSRRYRPATTPAPAGPTTGAELAPVAAITAAAAMTPVADPAAAPGPPGPPAPPGAPGAPGGQDGAGKGGRQRGRPARIAADHGGERGCGLRLLLLPGVPAVRPAGPGEKVTLNDALIAALVLTVDRWNDEHGRRPRTVRVTVPLNARAAHQRDLAGNHSRIVTVLARSPEPTADAGVLLRDVASQVRIARDSQGHQVPAGSRGIAAAWCPAAVKRWLVRFALRTAGPLICDTAMVTNLGRVPDPPDFGLSGTMTMGLSGPAQMPRGVSLAAITAGGRMQIGLRYNRALLDEDAAGRFLASYAMALREVADIEPTGADAAGRANVREALSNTSG